jgi:hypothetical protein
MSKLTYIYGAVLKKWINKKWNPIENFR